MTISSTQGEIKLGDRASLSKAFTARDVEGFAEISSDANPIHLDDEFASHSFFGRRIVHGMLTAGLISAVIGNQLPGPGSIYLSQTLQFKAPVFIGDTVTAVVEVTAIREDKRLVTLKTTCVNQDSKVVLEGEALVKVL